MKITCDSCGSKYTIADDKVQGRKVKVRCKNCKANILVDGTGDGAPSSDPPEAEEPATNQWTVNLSDEDSRDMSTEEIIAGWASGLVTEDAYVWRDGMTDWKPVLEVAELKMKLVTRPAASPEPAPIAHEPARPAASPVVSSAAGGLGGLSTGGGAAPRAAAMPGRPAEDFFGQSWGASAETDDDKRPTGARNENSVLFSLDALKAAPPEIKPKKPVITTSEDLFSMGTMPGGGLLNANVDLLTAPALAPPPAPVSVKTSLAAPKKGGSGMLIGAALIALAGLGGGYYFMTKQGSAETDAIRTAQADAEQKLKDAEAARKKLEEDLAKIRSEAQARGEDPAEAEKRAKAALAKADPKADGKEPAKEPAHEAPVAKEHAAASSSPGTSTKEPAKPSTATKESPSGGGGKSFDVASAKSALSAAAANASSCAQPGGPKGSGKVQVTFAPSGRVTTATIVEGPFGGTSVGGCISSTFKRARVPAFDGGPTSVAKSFKI